MVNNIFFYSFNLKSLSVIPLYFIEFISSLLLAISSYGIGRFFLSKLNKEFSFSEIFSLSLTTGFTVLGCYVFFLCALKLLYTSAIWIFIVSGILVGILSFKNKTFVKPQTKIFFKDFSFSDYLAAFLSIIILLVYLVFSYAPVVFYDALVYHLAVPQAYSLNHGFIDLSSNLYSNLFMFHGMIYAAAICAGKYFLPSLMNYFAFFIAASTLLSCAKRLFSPRAAVWSVLIFISIPMCCLASVNAGTETFGLMFCMASFLILCLGEKNEIKLTVLSGFFAGCAMSVKSICLLYVIGIMAALIYKNKDDYKNAFKQLVVFTVSASIIVIPWLVKNFIYRGNPFFPFLTSIFGYPDGYSDSLIKAFVSDTHPRVFGFVDWLIHPWSMLKGIGSDYLFFTPLYFFVLPLIFFVPVGSSIVMPFIFFLTGWFLWSLISEMSRFLIPVLPPASIVVYAIIDAITHKCLRTLLKWICLCVCVFLFSVSIMMLFSQQKNISVFNYVSEDDYLSNSQATYPFPSYAVIKYANEKLSPDSDKILISGDSRSYYSKIKTAASSVFDKQLLYRYASKSSNGKEMYEKMRSDGITHIIFNPSEGFRTGVFNDFKNDVMANATLNDFWINYTQKIYLYNEEQNGKIINTVFLLEVMPHIKGTFTAPNYINIYFSSKHK